ncbi:MAG TPA: MraY family glycosyltransferase [Candidatus Hydrogenedentes bacterium]|nr:MraY family glycosyltransferase [Candidatus Hydrogenedentota bacterium]
MMNWLSEWLLYAGLLCGTTALSAVLTEGARRLALRWGVLDVPAGRKIHHVPTPLLGGAAIVATFYLVTLGFGAVVVSVDRLGGAWLRAGVEGLMGPEGERKAVGILLGAVLMFLLGVVDDLRALRPRWKLAGQVAISLLTVWFGTRAELFIFRDPVTSTLLTVFWLVLVTNSMNLLDNMDGLCGGISIIAAATLALAMRADADTTLARVILFIFMGSVAGFLWHNRPPARIFMGDSGAMFNGFLLAAVSVAGTFHVAGEGPRLSVVAPLLALSVPLFDTLSVIWIRLRHGDSIFLGDKRHFSHRLVEAGMSRPKAVGFILLVAALVGLNAAMLPNLDTWDLGLVLLHTIGLFALIVILMRTGRGNQGEP